MTVPQDTAGAASATVPRLAVRNLRVVANTHEGPKPVLHGVDLTVAPGEVVALVGESGCGKTTTARAIMGILPTPGLETVDGVVEFDGRDLLPLRPSALNHIRGNDLSMVFQDPNASLNPVFTVGDQMLAVLRRHARRNGGGGSGRRFRREARRRIEVVLRQMQLPEPPRIMASYPFQLSGGMKQRILIAIALLNEPRLIVADEPGSALDVTVEDQILTLLESQIAERQLSMLFITHNLGVAKRVADRVAVMYGGRVVEFGDTATILAAPSHPYTQGLLAAVPRLRGGLRSGIPGRMPPVGRMPGGCPFHPRCPHRMPVCDEVFPEPTTVGESTVVSCHLYGEDRPIEVASPPGGEGDDG